jgi:putative glycosyltransferase (TIGR04372 family)
MKNAIKPFITLLLRMIPQLIFICAVLPMLYMIRPYRKIIIHKLIYNRIGHLAGNSDFELRRRQIYDLPLNEVHIYISGTPVNRQIVKMLKKHLVIFEGVWLIRGFFAVEKLLQKTPFYQPDTWNEYDCLREIATTHATLSFTQDEENRGRQALREMGIGDDDWFVCVHSRDSQYLKEANPEGNWEYHDYRDCSIKNYLPAMQYITEQGGYVLRMGSVVSEQLEDSCNPRIIDYACKHRSDFMDIFASAKCRFFLGSTAGLFNVAWVFDVPIAHANMTPLSVLPFRQEDLFIPKLLRKKSNQEMLSLDAADKAALFNPEVRGLFTSKYYDEMGLEFIENSPDEILGLTVEMFAKLEGHEVEKSFRELQSAYKSKFMFHINDADLVGDISWNFLHKHQKITGLSFTPHSEDIGFSDQQKHA